MTTEADIQAALETRLPGKFKPDVWAKLVAAGRVAYAAEHWDISPDVAVADLVADYEEFDQPDVRNNAPPDRRAEALAKILALEAGELAAVRAFRSGLPRKRLLDPNKAVTWISRLAQAEGPPTILVTVPDDDRDATRPVERRVVTLDHPDADGPILISTRGRLGELKRIAGLLHARYSWSEGSAVDFVLTGRVPRLPLAKVGATAHLRYAPLGTVILSVNARMSPSEVARLYSNTRRALIGFGRDRELEDEWRADLAVFISERAQAESSWREEMAAWNAMRPEHKFKDWRVFQRACRRSYEQVTGRSLDWKSSRDTRNEED